jgi:dTMP kinase
MSTGNSFFLVIEGLDGSGKTEMTRRLAKNLKSQFGDDVYLTFEPHDPSCAGLFLRQNLTKMVKADPLTEALAFAANRLDHCDRIINPFLAERRNQHRIVISDRYYLSSLVYQTNENISLEDVMNLNKKARKPDLIMFFNASNAICSERMKKRNQYKELYETNLSETRRKYLEAIEYLESRGENVVEIDANGSPDDVLTNMIIALNDNSPEWLKVQHAFNITYEVEVINVNGGNEITLSDVAQDVVDNLLPYPIILSGDMTILLNKVEDEVKNIIFGKSLDELGYLFLDYLRVNNFSVGEKFSWSDIDAFYVDYSLPLSFPLQGIAILGNELYKEMIIQRKLRDHNFDALSFILLFLPSVRQIENYFESEYIITKDDILFAPSIKKFYKDDLVSALISQVVKLIQLEYFETMSALPNIKSELIDFCTARDLS